MNLGSLLLGLLLMVLLVRATYWWAVQELAARWYEEQSQGIEHAPGKPWFVLSYDRWVAKRKGFPKRS